MIGRRSERRCLVIYESIFGCTAQIAEAVHDGLRTARGHLGEDRVDIVEVDNAPTDLTDVDLLVVGAPTHTYSLSRPSTRETADLQKYEAPTSDRIGIREWLESLEMQRGGHAASFTTILSKPALNRLLPNAGHLMERQLRRHGRMLIADTEEFFVEGIQGPLVVGEVERAQEWGARIGHRFARLEHPRRGDVDTADRAVGDG